MIKDIRIGGIDVHLTNYIISKRLNEDNTLMINTLSGAMDIIDNSTLDLLSDFQNSYNENMIDEDLIETLKERNYIFKNDQVEREAMDKFVEINKITKQNIQTSFTICPTLACNLRCVYCFEDLEKNKHLPKLNEGQVDSILNHIDLSIENMPEPMREEVNITIFGGEPLLKSNYDINKRILEFAKEREIPLQIVTNGTTIDYYREFLISYDKIIVQITLDGNKEIHDARRIRVDGSGTYDKIQEGLNIISKLNIPVNLRINIDKNNIEGIKQLEEDIKNSEWIKSGNIKPYISPVLDHSIDESHDFVFSASELYENVLDRIPKLGSEYSPIQHILSTEVGYIKNLLDTNIEQKFWKVDYCEATSGRNIIFSPDGQVTTCLLLAGKNKHYIGTFDEDGVYLDDELKDQWFGRNIFRMEKCKDCKYALVCGGGCPVAAIEINSDINDPICSDVERMFDIFVERNKDNFLRILE